MAVWPPTRVSMLEYLYRAAESYDLDSNGSFLGKGLAVFSPEYVDPLVEEGLAQYLPQPNNPKVEYGIKGACCLTDKGKQAAELLMKIRTISNYRQPDWLLKELTSR